MALRPELQLGAVTTETPQRLGQRALAPLGMVVEQGIDLGLVLGGMDRAGGIDEPSARAHQLERLVEELPLQHLQLGDGRRVQAPAGTGMAGQGAQTRAGGIKENAIRAAMEVGQGAGIGAPGLDGPQFQAPGIALQAPQAGRGAINGNDPALVAHQFSHVGRLATGGSAHVHHHVAGLGLK